jgi:DNA-binding response OmpR family regulator
VAPAGDRGALLVDDDSKAELIVRALLEPEGYAVEVVKTAADAGERLRAREWGIVIVDGGISADGKLLLVDQLATGSPRPSSTRLVVSTSDPAVAGRCRGAGFAVLPRPFLPKDLLVAMGGLLHSR